MALLKTALVSTLLLYSQTSYSPTPSDYNIPASRIVSGAVRWEIRDEIPGHGFSVAHVGGNYFFYSSGDDAQKLRELVEARSSIEIQYDPKPKLFDHLIPITIDNIVSINGKELLR